MLYNLSHPPSSAPDLDFSNISSVISTTKNLKLNLPALLVIPKLTYLFFTILHASLKLKTIYSIEPCLMSKTLNAAAYEFQLGSSKPLDYFITLLILSLGVLYLNFILYVDKLFL